MHRFLAELKRRRVFRVAAGYAVVAFVLIQVADLLVPALLLPDWIFRGFVLVVLLGFPVALVLAWAYDLTAHGIERTPGRDPGAPADARELPAPFSQRRAAAYLGIGILVALVGFGLTVRLTSDESSDAAVDADRSIAVLPFANLSADRENEYFADGMTEEILTALSRVDDLRVISRTSVMSYKGSDKRLGDIARELGVRVVLEGSVRRAGGRVRITAQLIDADSDEHLWAENYDRQLSAENLFDIQAEIAREIVRSLRARLSPEERRQLAPRATADLRAYDLYLRGLEAARGAPIEGKREAIRLFRSALDRDPRFAAAWAQIGAAYLMLQMATGSTALADSARDAVARSLELQPELGEAHAVRGLMLMTSNRYDEALAAFQEALRVEPSNPTATSGIAWYYGERGELVEATRWFRRVVAVEPTHGDALTWLAFTYAAIGDLVRAGATVRDALRFHPNNLTAHSMLGLVAVLQHDTAEVRTRIAAIERLAGDVPAGWRALGDLALMIGDDATARAWYERVLAAVEDEPSAGNTGGVTAAMATLRPTVDLAVLERRAGNRARAEQLLEQAVARANAMLDAGDRSAMPFELLARVRAVRGDVAGAVTALETARERGSVEVLIYPSIDPAYDAIRADPRFRSLLDRFEARRQEMRARLASR